MKSYTVYNSYGDFEATLFDRREAEKLMVAVNGHLVIEDDEHDEVEYEFFDFNESDAISTFNGVPYDFW